MCKGWIQSQKCQQKVAMEVLGLRSPRKESGTCQIREGVLGMEAEEETALNPKTYRLESPGEETEHMTHKLVRDSAASKQYTESPHSRLHRCLMSFLQTTCKNLTQGCSLCFLAHPTKPCESCSGPSHLFLASCLQLPKSRADERWNYLSGFCCRLGQLWSLTEKPLEIKDNLESHQQT